MPRRAPASPYSQNTTTAFANFNGAQLEVERRFKQGLAFQAFWVLANTLTEAGSVPSNNSFMPGAVPTDFEAAGTTHSEKWTGQMAFCDPPFFATVGARLMKGRFLNEADIAGKLSI